MQSKFVRAVNALYRIHIIIAFLCVCLMEKGMIYGVIGLGIGLWGFFATYVARMILGGLSHHYCPFVIYRRTNEGKQRIEYSVSKIETALLVGMIGGGVLAYLLISKFIT